MIELSFVKKSGAKVSGTAREGEYVYITEPKPSSMECYVVTLPDGRKTIVCTLRGDTAALEKFLSDFKVPRDSLRPIV